DTPGIEKNRNLVRGGKIISGAKLEQALVFEKELAFLWKEQTEPREIDLLLVGFDLCEIRIERNVGRQVLRQPIFHIEANISFGFVVEFRYGRGVAREAADSIWLHLDVP